MNNQPSIIYLLSLTAISIALMAWVPALVSVIQANEITIGICRLAIAALGIAVFAKFRRKPLINKAALPWLFLLGGVFAGHWFTYFKALKLSSASLGAIGISTFGLHLLYLNYFFFKQKLQLSHCIVVIIALGGVMLATPDPAIAPQQLLGFMIGIFSGFLYALLPIINRKAQHLTTEQRAFGQFGFGLLFYIWFTPWGNWDLSPFDWFGLAILGIFSSLIAHTLWVKVTTELPNNITATVYYFYVPIAIGYSYFFFDEQLTWQKLLGGGIIIAANIGIILMQRTTKSSSNS